MQERYLEEFVVRHTGRSQTSVGAKRNPPTAWAAPTLWLLEQTQLLEQRGVRLAVAIE